MNIKYNLFKSEDAKAYYKPNTSVQLDIWPVVESTDVEKMFCLPKYDFPINTLNVSPGSDRIQTIVPLSVGDEVKYVPAMDQSAVFMRPKEEIGSTGSVFASEDLKLIYESPAIYEVSGTGKNTSFERYLSYY